MSANVLHLIDSFNRGGTEGQAVQLASKLRESGRYNVFVACLNSEGPLYASAASASITTIPEYRLNSFYDRNMLAQVGRFAGFLKRNKIDIVHTHDFYTNIFGMISASVARVPIRIASKRETSGIRSSAQQTVERMSYRFARTVIANADAVKQVLMAEGVGPDKIVVIPNGLDFARFNVGENFDRSAALLTLRLPERRRLVTMVANLKLEVKDHPTFLRAAQVVHRAIPGVGFVLAGEGPLLEKTRTLAAELGLAEDVFFIGRCEQVEQLLAVSDVCVLSSKAEGFSNSILEYMAASKPVVATDVGGAREAIIDGETGFIVDPGDSVSMAVRLIEILQEPSKARSMGERGRRIAFERFSCDVQLAHTEELYSRLLVNTNQASGGTTAGLPRKY
jgi:glycosyltransferase involved in cell wall biosynthesis